MSILKKLQNGKKAEKLTHDELIALSDVYEVTHTIFLMEMIPYDKEITDFRTANSEKIKPELMFELRRAEEKRETLINFEDDFENSIWLTCPKTILHTGNHSV